MKVLKVAAAIFQPLVWYGIYSLLYKQSVSVNAEYGLMALCVFCSAGAAGVLLYETYKNE